MFHIAPSFHEQCFQSMFGKFLGCPAPGDPGADHNSIESVGHNKEDKLAMNLNIFPVIDRAKISPSEFLHRSIVPQLLDTRDLYIILRPIK
jgi:hypothetical protein